jgi:hypothetical protein
MIFSKTYRYRDDFFQNLPRPRRYRDDFFKNLPWRWRRGSGSTAMDISDVSLDKDYFESVLVMKKRKWREEIFGRR